MYRDSHMTVSRDTSDKTKLVRSQTNTPSKMSLTITRNTSTYLSLDQGGHAPIESEVPEVLNILFLLPCTFKLIILVFKT